MKEAFRISHHTDHLSGQVTFATDAAFASKRIIVTPPNGYILNRRDNVVCSIDDLNGDFPFGMNLAVFGGITASLLVQIFLVNNGAPFLTPDIFVNYIVLPKNST